MRLSNLSLLLHARHGHTAGMDLLLRTIWGCFYHPNMHDVVKGRILQRESQLMLSQADRQK